MSEYEIVIVERDNDSEIIAFKHHKTFININVKRKIIFDFMKKRSIPHYYNLYGQNDLNKAVIEPMVKIGFLPADFDYKSIKCDVQLNGDILIHEFPHGGQVIYTLKLYRW